MVRFEPTATGNRDRFLRLPVSLFVSFLSLIFIPLFLKHIWSAGAVYLMAYLGILE